MKLFIVGHGRHGKDTLAEMIREYAGLSFQSSSMFAAKNVVMPYLSSKWGITYRDVAECFDDRHAHRMRWAEAINEYNRRDKSRLSRGIFNSYSMYVGIRSRDEFLASKHLADLAIFVCAAQRVQSLDPTCLVKAEDCDIVVFNNGSEEDLRHKAKVLSRGL